MGRSAHKDGQRPVLPKVLAASSPFMFEKGTGWKRAGLLVEIDRQGDESSVSRNPGQVLKEAQYALDEIEKSDSWGRGLKRRPPTPDLRWLRPPLDRYKAFLSAVGEFAGIR